MFGLSLSFLPFVDGSDGSRNDAPVVLSHDQVEEIGRELDALRDRTVADLGAEDREYIYKIIKAQRGFEVAGRGLMYLASSRRPGSPGSGLSVCRRFSTTWRSATTSCTASTTGCGNRA